VVLSVLPVLSVLSVLPVLTTPIVAVGAAVGSCFEHPPMVEISTAARGNATSRTGRGVMGRTMWLCSHKGRISKTLGADPTFAWADAGHLQTIPTQQAR